VITVRICHECGSLVPKIPKMEALHDCIAHALVKKAEYVGVCHIPLHPHCL
jgi:hypothetical protein